MDGAYDAKPIENKAKHLGMFRALPLIREEQWLFL
jgi:hypothetical protein